MNEELVLKNHLKEVRTEKKLSQAQLAEMVGVSRNTISSIESPWIKSMKYYFINEKFSVKGDLITEKLKKTGYPLSRRKKGGTCDEVKE